MSRGEEIKIAAGKEYFRMSQGVDYNLAIERELGFLRGAEWADRNPQQQELPLDPEPNKSCHAV